MNWSVFWQVIGGFGLFLVCCALLWLYVRLGNFICSKIYNRGFSYISANIITAMIMMGVLVVPAAFIVGMIA